MGLVELRSALLRQQHTRSVDPLHRSFIYKKFNFQLIKGSRKKVLRGRGGEGLATKNFFFVALKNYFPPKKFGN